jgi:SOS-response transcriptional repressor LexA
VPYALTKRQREYLDFIRAHIAENEFSPSLKEIAEHFGVTPPTAHKMLAALSRKNCIAFGRTSYSGFFIRVIERAGSPEIVLTVPVVGHINRYGEIVDFPRKHGQFGTVLQGADPTKVCGMILREDIPEAHMLAHDTIIFDIDKKPQPGDVCVVPMGNRYFLALIAGKTLDIDTPSLELLQNYPIPEDLTKEELRQWIAWTPLAFSEETEAFFEQVCAEEEWPYILIPPELVIVTALRMSRHLSL